MDGFIRTNWLKMEKAKNKAVAEFRKRLRKGVDTWELQSLDSKAVLLSFLITSTQVVIAILSAIGLIPSWLLPFILIDVFIVLVVAYIPYRIAIIKKAIDLRIYVFKALSYSLVLSIVWGYFVALAFTRGPILFPDSVVNMWAEIGVELFSVFGVAVGLGLLVQWLSPKIFEKENLWLPQVDWKALHILDIQRGHILAGAAFSIFFIWLLSVPWIITGAMIPPSIDFDPTGIIAWSVILLGAASWLLYKTYKGYGEWKRDVGQHLEMYCYIPK
jgi:hypothetical protein